MKSVPNVVARLSRTSRQTLMERAGATKLGLHEVVKKDAP